MNAGYRTGLGLLLLLVSFAPFARSAVKLDGVLDEAIWQEAMEFRDFLVIQPKTFSEPTVSTRALVASDEAGLYIGFINQQAHFGEATKTSLFDQDIGDDYNQVIMTFGGKGRTGYGFILSRTNAKQDAIWRNENQEQRDWNGDWQHATAQDAQGWRSEIFIPWASFSMDQVGGETRDISVYFARWHQGLQQTFAYPAIDAAQPLFLSKFASMQIQNADYSSLDWFPYLATRANRVTGTVTTDSGVTLSWRPSPDNHLSVALNPDFGQVESDELVVNFSAIESFFEEKRPFFVENHAMFDVRGPENLMLVNTRRIGAADEDSRDIDVAARVTHFGEHFEMGALAARESAHQQVHRKAQERTFMAARWSLLGEDYNWGLLLNRMEEGPFAAQILATDLAIEFDERWQITALLLQSHLDNISLEQADIATPRTDLGWTFSVSNQTTPTWQQTLSVLRYGQALSVNDVGFVERVNLRQVSYASVKEWSQGIAAFGIADHALELGADIRENEQGLTLINEYDLTLILNTQQNQELEVEYEYQAAGFDDLLTFGHHPVKLPAGHGTKLSFKTDQTKRIVWDMSASIGKSGLSGDWFELEFEPTFQLSDNLNLGVEIVYLTQDSWLLSLFEEDEGEEASGSEGGIEDELDEENEEEGEEDELEDEFDDEIDISSDNLLGHYKQKELSLGVYLAGRWQKHELSIKAEAVAVEGRGKQLMQAQENGRLLLIENSLESFSESEFVMQIRYRYELGPRSSIYVVYGRGGEFDADHTRHSERRMLNKALAHRDEENILVKASFHF
mgnify:CR=1 FL=1